ncbi:MAG: hypothetical protein MPW17_06515 [Candidatus Manganitrophus sp.]|nr:MAG: hypothetical protein MPW17_06515 [Candidatus Manganitrophus sp.]
MLKETILLVEDNPADEMPIRFRQFTDAVKQLGLYRLLLNEPLRGDKK